MKKINILILLFPVSFFSCKSQVSEDYAIVLFRIGNVTINGASAEMGDIVREKDKIKTANKSFCDIKIGKSVIRIKQKSQVLIGTLLAQGNIESTEVEMNVGKILCKPKKLLKNEKFIIKTPTAVAGVRGTKFSVEVDNKKTTRLKVYGGKVKVAKRIKKFDNDTDKIMAVSNSVSQNQKVIITKRDAQNAEKLVDKHYQKKSKKGVSDDVLLAEIAKKLKKEITVSNKNIQRFKASDLLQDRKELIDIKSRSRDDVKKIANELNKEPVPEGRLLVTRYNVYFIKDGMVKWEGKITNSPTERDGKLYIASDDHVFCADPDGPVIWKAKIINDGSIRFEGKELIINSNGKEHKFDSKTGRKIL